MSFPDRNMTPQNAAKHFADNKWPTPKKIINIQYRKLEGYSEAARFSVEGSDTTYWVVTKEPPGHIGQQMWEVYSAIDLVTLNQSR